VRRSTAIPEVGERPPKIETDTVASAGGDIESIETRVPPDEMHDVDFQDVVGETQAASRRRNGLPDCPFPSKRASGEATLRRPKWTICRSLDYTLGDARFARPKRAPSRRVSRRALIVRSSEPRHLAGFRNHARLSDEVASGTALPGRGVRARASERLGVGAVRRV
jgi:hypothetical protein